MSAGWAWPPLRRTTAAAWACRSQPRPARSLLVGTRPSSPSGTTGRRSPRRAETGVSHGRAAPRKAVATGRSVASARARAAVIAIDAIIGEQICPKNCSWLPFAESGCLRHTRGLCLTWQGARAAGPITMRQRCLVRLRHGFKRRALDQSWQGGCLPAQAQEAVMEALDDRNAPSRSPASTHCKRTPLNVRSLCWSAARQPPGLPGLAAALQSIGCEADCRSRGCASAEEGMMAC